MHDSFSRPQPPTCVLLLLASVVLMLSLIAALPQVGAVSDKSLKRRSLRQAFKTEKMMDERHEASDDAELSQHENTLNATYLRVLNEVVAAKAPEVTLGAEAIPTLQSVIHFPLHQCVFHGQRWLSLFPDASGVRVGGAFRGVDSQRITVNPFDAMLLENPFANTTGSSSTVATPAAAPRPPPQAPRKGAPHPPPPPPPVTAPPKPAPCGPSRNCSATSNPCAFYYTPYEEMFSGVDKLILIGDSTILRVFKFLQNARDAEFRQKVSDLKNPHIMLQLRLSTSRFLEVHFFRLLYASMAPLRYNEAFQIATVNSLVYTTLGPHDTSWLIFDRSTFYQLHVMPGMSLAKDVDRRSGKRVKQSDVLKNNFMRAKAYWLKHAAGAAAALGTELQQFEERVRAQAEKEGRVLAPGEPLRPVVVFREQLMPKCSDPKYASHPHTRCIGMLRPVLVPFMRDYLRAMLTLVNVPTIGMDAVSGRAGLPCHLIDAGHLPRPCTTIEIEMASYTFRMVRRLRVTQGYTDHEAYGKPPSIDTLLGQDGGITWQHLSRRVTHLRPQGDVHPNEFVRSNPIYQSSGMVLPQPNLYAASEWKLFAKFDDPASIERAVAVVGGFRIPPGSWNRTSFAANSSDADAALGDLMDKAQDEENQSKKAMGTEDTAATTAPGASDDTVKAGESAVDLTKSEMEAALETVHANTTFDDIDDIMGRSTYGRHFKTDPVHTMGAVAIASLFALTIVAFLMWRVIE